MASNFLHSVSIQVGDEIIDAETFQTEGAAKMRFNEWCDRDVPGSTILHTFRGQTIARLTCDPEV